MYSCPACGAGDVARLVRCRCGADLALLHTLDAIADAWFNQWDPLESTCRHASLSIL